MLERLAAFFNNPEEYKTELPDADAPHAMGALLVRAAKADDAYLFEEIAIIDKILGQRHGLNPIDAAKMRAECELLEKDIPETQEIAAIVNHAISTAEKEATLLALWRVVYADGVKHDQEDRLLHHIERVLGIKPNRAKELQQKATA
ncbi:TerB family tellurite resistance protein [Yoonia sp. BS5-3]|uniref:TerB family tellurite resistance protein n=1 Tax=Yoonia phaeophyticola TaxID=3137369 RepID=A0ABZ2V6H9_9RHOB